MKNTGAILGDDMGLGKTVQSIGFLIAVISRERRKKRAAREPVLICIPASLVENWSRELIKWGQLGEISFEVCKYIGKDRKSLLSSNTWEILLTTYDTFRIDFLELNSISWACVLFDEVHKLKERKSQVTNCAVSLKTLKRYGLTGTVMQNDFDELFTLLDFIRPDCLGTLSEFNERYIKPIKNGQRRDASDEDFARSRAAATRLNRAVEKVVLRRDNSILKDVLPGKDDTVVFCRPTPVQLRIYRRVLESDGYSFLIRQAQPCECKSTLKRGNCCGRGENWSGDWAGDGKEEEEESDSVKVNWKKSVLPCITNLKKIAQHPELLVPNKIVDESDEQAVAKRERAEKFMKLAFGDEEKNIFDMMNDNIHSKLSCKIRTLQALLKVWKTKGNKILLFSSSTHMLDILQRMLNHCNYTWCRLDGTTDIGSRQSIIDRFNSSSCDEYFVFLISTRAGGLGLNITSANIVVIYDASWNVTHDLQAQDRAYRIGQTKFCYVYRLITVGTIEEMIYQRQVYKQQMANIGMEGKHERRYFTGVLGVKGEEGEIFGLLNLLSLSTEKILSKELLERVNAEEGSYKEDQKANPTCLSTNPNECTSPKETVVVVSDEDQEDDKHSLEQDVEATLWASDVAYFQKNDRVVGESEVEKKRALEAKQLIRKEFERDERISGGGGLFSSSSALFSMKIKNAVSMHKPLPVVEPDPKMASEQIANLRQALLALQHKRLAPFISTEKK
eukprot:TRINITY_DN9226_c0_g1_i1.p1 TRINITY_DN9226_c0_g1~~TRINITY_DN9226_c0_g1_i1.p1  ORF type:complete len:835 (+),score=192.04 TRINITY_DN9226_c0_g1_i1:310-2505(+)